MANEKKMKALKISTVALLLLAMLAVLIYFWKEIGVMLGMVLAGDKSLRSYMQSLGVMGWLIFVFLQFIQAVLTFLPSDPIMLAAGASYGYVQGILICWTGTVLGAQFLFLVHKFVLKKKKKSKSDIEFEQQIRNSKKNIWLLFALLYVMPAVPFGLIAVVAISLGLKYWKFFVITAVGPIVPISLTVLLGSQLASPNPVVSFIIFVVIITGVLVVVFNRKKIVKLVFRESKTLDEKIDSMKTKKPRGWVYKLFLPIYRKRVFKKNNARIIYETDISKLKEPFLMLANHPTRTDYVYAAMALLPHKVTYVVNRYFYHDKLLVPLLRAAGTIPKKLFQPDISAMKKILKAAENGHNIGVFAEGINSYSGESMGIAPATAKLVKRLKMPVIGVYINGAFLTNAKWRQKEEGRMGRVDITVKELLSKEQTASLSVDDIHKRISEELYYDDFDWASKNKVEYTGGNLASNLNYAIYLCPRCHSEFKMNAEGDTIRCSECGNGASINKYYELVPFDDSCIIPQSISAWYNLQKADMFEKVQATNFNMEDNVILRMFSKNGHKEVDVGEGRLSLDKDGLKYSAVSGKAVNLDIPRSFMPDITLNYNDSIELYFEDVFYAFAMSDKISAIKWSLAVSQIYKYYVAASEK